MFGLGAHRPVADLLELAADLGEVAREPVTLGSDGGEIGLRGTGSVLDCPAGLGWRLRSSPRALGLLRPGNPRNYRAPDSGSGSNRNVLVKRSAAHPLVQVPTAVSW